MKKKIAIVFIFLQLVLSGCASQNDFDTTLAKSLSEQSLHLVRYGEDSGSYVIKCENIKAIEDYLPEKVDLRELGIVTDVKDQDPFGTCVYNSARSSLTGYCDYPNKH